MSEIAKRESNLPHPLDEYSELQKHVARLYGAGISRAQIARALVDHLAPNKQRGLEARIASARTKLKRWEQVDRFRDLVYHYAIIQLDMDTPSIIKGITKKAKRGRVDAARLTLELTGRHNPKGENAPAQVVIAINGVARPAAPTPEAIITEGRELDESDTDD